MEYCFRTTKHSYTGTRTKPECSNDHKSIEYVGYPVHPPSVGFICLLMTLVVVCFSKLHSLISVVLLLEPEGEFVSEMFHSLHIRLSHSPHVGSPVYNILYFPDYKSHFFT